MELMTGRIMKATGGFYYVDCAGEMLECRAKGIFRKEGISPLVGDIVRVEPTVENEGCVSEILTRKNEMIRPPLANLDTFVLVTSVSDPPPNLLVLDTMMAIVCHKSISPMIVITKSDLGRSDMLEKIYGSLGIPIFTVSQRSGEGLDKIIEALSHGVSAFSGNSGVGKSSLLNRIDSRFLIETGQTSKKLGRGKHTTRHVELYRIGDDGFIADTPGFSSVDMERYEHIGKEELADCFLEFAPFLGKCRYTSCSHTVEDGCAVLEALRQGKINESRHANYKTLYEESRKQKDWQHK